MLEFQKYCNYLRYFAKEQMKAVDTLYERKIKVLSD